jgi:metal-sulfur cluster biosynthetic enzyme
MSDEPINANPQVKDVSQLPTRKSKNTEDVITQYEHIIHKSKLNSLVKKYSFNNEVNDSDEEQEDDADNDDEPIDSQEVYDLISSISDPEHPLTLGQLSVVNLGDIQIKHPDLNHGEVGEITVQITPTITHCSLATLIGLGIRVRLDRSVAKVYRTGIYVKQGTHQSEGQVNKQLNDKERVCAACENPQLVKVVGQMLSTCVI